jgi:hypothetical protein
MPRGQDTGNHPGRRVHRDRFSDTRVTMIGPSTREAGNVGVTMDPYGAMATGRPAGFYQREAIGPLGGAEAFERDISNEGYDRDQRRGRNGLYSDER